VEKKLMVNESEISIKTKQENPPIKVVTYNIHRGINKSNKLDLDGITEVIMGIGADIVALQEVERFSIRTGFKDQIGYIAEKLSMNYAYGKSINILNGQYGNAILTRYPIEEYEVKQLYSEGETRTLLRVALSINGSRIQVYNTHLGLNSSEREKQIREIIDITANADNYILAGDFNSAVDKLDAVTGKLKDAALYDVNKYRIPTFDNGDITERIDYIFLSEKFKIVGYEVLKSDASDHYPVTVVVKLED
jgi:endonuclease/exonuclease/phosphatase family metal-dependent hydrolase